MYAGVLHGCHDIRIEERAGRTLADGQVLLRVRRAGICGSDIHYFNHGYCGRFVPSRPFVLGHEFVATVEAVSSDVQTPTAGERVVVNPATSCGHCEACRSGRGNLCNGVVMLGSASTTPPTDGAFAEYVVIAAHQCFSIPDRMTDADAAMMEPLSVALHAIRRAGDIVSRRVLISGGGPIGLLTARSLRALGASLVVISEPDKVRRDIAAELAADHALDPICRDYVDSAIALSGGGFDAVFEASGAAVAVRTSLEVVRRGGTVVQIGTISENKVSLPMNDVMVREISVHGSFRYAAEFPDAIRLVDSGRICLEGLVTSTFPFAQLPLALETATQNAQSLKVHITLDGGGS